MDSNPKRRRFYKSQSIICLDGLSSGANTSNQNIGDQRIIPKTTSDIVRASQGQRLFSLGLPPLDVATNRTSPPLFGGFLHACRWCKEKIEKDRYMYGDFSAFCSVECRENQMISENYIAEICSKSGSTAEETGDIEKK